MSVKGFSQQPNNPEELQEITLRPREWSDYIGQERIKNNLKIIIGAAKKEEKIQTIFFFMVEQG